MKNIFGNVLSMTIFGESHGPETGCVLSGLAPGIPVSEDEIRRVLSLRRPAGAISTARVEADEFRIVSGVCNGFTTGTPLCILIPNTSAKSSDYSAIRDLARPGHADYTAFLKYHGFEDPRGGGFQSGRLTAALVAAGGILLPALERKGIRIGTHIRALGGGEAGGPAFIEDAAFSADEDMLNEEIGRLRTQAFPVLDPAAGEKMQARILRAKEDGDSVGGILESAVTGVPGGVGEPWFDSVESMLSHILFSIPAVKGVEFGEAFSTVSVRGSAYNDEFGAKEAPGAGKRIFTRTNHNGGLNGGITNGMPILFRTAVKPTPSVSKAQQTVNFRTMEETEISVPGRHDPAIIHRAGIVVSAAAALAAADLLAVRFGTDWLASDAE